MLGQTVDHYRIKDRERRYQTAAEMRAELRRRRRDMGTRQAPCVSLPAAPVRSRVPGRMIAGGLLNVVSDDVRREVAALPAPGPK